MKRIFSLSIIVLAAVAAGAQDKWSLDSCINYAVSHSISVKNAQVQKDLAELSVTEAKDAFLPNVSANASQSFNFGRGLTNENTYENRNTSSFSWGASMSLPLFDGLSNVRQLKYAKINLQSQFLKLESAKDNVTLNVISQYLQALYYKELVNTAKEQAELSKYEVSRQESLVESGKVAEIDLIQARAQLAQDELSVTTNQNDAKLALLDLAQLLQLPDIENFDIEPLTESSPIIPSAEDVYSQAQNINNGILAARNNVKAADAQVSLAKSGYLPRLSFNLGVGSSYVNMSGLENKTFSQQMRDNYSTSLGFTLSIPIFDAFSTRNAVRRAKVQAISAKLNLQDTETQLQKDIQQAYYRAVAAREKYDAGLKTEDAAQQAFVAMKEKYELGRSTPTEFEQAKTTYLKSTIDRLQSHYEYIMRCRILDFYYHNK